MVHECFLNMTVWSVMPCGMLDNYQPFKESSACHEVFPAEPKIAVLTEACFSLPFLISSFTSTHKHFRL